MAEKWVVQETRTRTVGTTPCYEFAILKADGTLHLHLMPTIALEWRATEYGIDPTDVDTLLDVILHEPHMQMTDDGSGPRFADDGPDVWTAETADAARTAHLARIKSCPVQIGVRGAKPLDAVRTGHRPDQARLRAMREVVDTTRWIKRHGGLPQPPKNPMEADRLRAAAGGPTGKD